MFLSPWNANNPKQRRASRRRRLGHSCDICYARKVQFNVMQPSPSAIGAPIRICRAPFSDIVLRAKGAQAQPISSYKIEAARMPPPRDPFPSPQIKDRAAETWAPTFARNLQSAGRHLGNICTFNGVHVLSTSSQEWMKACTGEELHLDRYHSAQVPWWQHPPTDPTPQGLSSSSLDLPEPAFLYEELKHYQSSTFGLFFPILDPSLFESTVRAACYQESSAASPGLSSAKACIFAFLALAPTVVHGSRRHRLKSSFEYVCEAYRLLPEVFKEPVSLDGLQTLLLLCLCSQGLAGDFFTIDHLLSTVSRFIYHLKANLSPRTVWENPTALDYHARHLFWIAYICDKGFSLVTGLAPVLEDAQCNLAFAVMHGEFDQPEEQLHLYGDPYPGSYVDMYARLAFIQSLIYRDLYTPSALGKPDADLPRTIRDLDHSIEEWKDSIPFENRPSLTTTAPQDSDMRSSVFHLQYHHCMIMIHQASSRCASWEQNQDTRGTSSSLAISVAASRSFLRGFLYSQLELGSQNLLFTLSYFLQASINLFCKILSRPLDTGNQEDLHIIGMISQLIANHHRDYDPECYTEKIKFAGGVIGELKRLAQCAIDKANREQDQVVGPQ
ncbi:hypothetical protein BO78DRAFT_430633 [Aspergillus sclerotiicarbonarius CBS 121057]|uniref:Xylanolytic transcriptional activator regulatory domain-containing protein n=1 Tax=Aspergillus sclerotiicarbonarius (strain CBS 121057 / IBT 28362) TaxID=1448318 RepID=A0A319E5U1_ASPSB|nr:hypothetical protein BO78DRAFT_430633 [Aspergillus sclerotiicarbonarius CBS 121057]